MAVPQILQQLGGASMMIPPQVKSLMQMVKNAGNPQAMMDQLAQSNPQIKQVMDIVKQSGNDPKRAFYALAEKKGVNPEDILKQLR